MSKFNEIHTILIKLEEHDKVSSLEFIIHLNDLYYNHYIENMSHYKPLETFIKEYLQANKDERF